MDSSSHEDADDSDEELLDSNSEYDYDNHGDGHGTRTTGAAGTMPVDARLQVVFLPTQEMRDAVGDTSVQLRVSNNRDLAHGLCHVHVHFTMKASRGVLIGTMQAHIIDRIACLESGGNLIDVCDDHSSELLDFAALISTPRGDSLIEPLCSQVTDAGTAAHGGLFYVEQVDVVKQFQGHDFGLLILYSGMDLLRDKFTLAGLYPAPWGVDGRGQAASDTALLQHKIGRIGHHFARLGFRQVGDSGYAFLEASALPHQFAPIPKNDPSIPSMTVRIDKRPRGPPPLVNAVCEGDVRGVKRLLAAADVCDVCLSAADPSGKTALHFAAEMRHPTLTRLLLAAGADALAENVRGETPLQLMKAGEVLPDTQAGSLARRPNETQAAKAVIAMLQEAERAANQLT